jgi:hypothetical protein
MFESGCRLSDTCLVSGPGTFRTCERKNRKRHKHWHRATTGNPAQTKKGRHVRSVGADVSQKILEQHVDLFSIHVLANVIDPNNRNVGVPNHVFSQAITRSRNMHSRDAVFDPAHALPHIVENRQNLVCSRTAVAADNTERRKQLASGNYFVGSLVAEGGLSFNQIAGWRVECQNERKGKNC